MSISGVPMTGTGLSGAAFVTGNWIGNPARAIAAAAGMPVANFSTTEVHYKSHKSDTTIAQLLAQDGTLIIGYGTDARPRCAHDVDEPLRRHVR